MLIYFMKTRLLVRINLFPFEVMLKVTLEFG